MSDLEVSEALATFLENLKEAEPDALVRAPGIGLYRAHEIRRGLATGAIQVHHLGLGLAFTAEEAVVNGRRAWTTTAALRNWEAWLAAKTTHDRPAASGAARRLLQEYLARARPAAEAVAGGRNDPWSLD